MSNTYFATLWILIHSFSTVYPLQGHRRLEPFQKSLRIPWTRHQFSYPLSRRITAPHCSRTLLILTFIFHQILTSVVNTYLQIIKLRYPEIVGDDNHVYAPAGCTRACDPSVSSDCHLHHFTFYSPSDSQYACILCALNFRSKACYQSYVHTFLTQ